MKSIRKNTKADGELIWVFIVLFCIAMVVVVMVGMPVYNVWTKEMSGKADLANAEWSKQIAIEEAKAELESASLKAAAEVERAKGVAEANAIIGDSLKDNDAYLRYLWIQGLHDGSSETIYIPKYDTGIDPYAPVLTGGARPDTHSSGKVEGDLE